MQNTKIHFVCPTFLGIGTQLFLWSGSQVARVNSQYSGADKSLALPDWKKQLKGRQFSSDAEVIGAAQTWLDGQHLNFFEWLVRVKVWSL